MFHRLVNSEPETCRQDRVGAASWCEQLVAIRVCGQTLFADVTAIQKEQLEALNSGVAVRSEDFGRCHGGLSDASVPTLSRSPPPIGVYATLS